MRPSLCQPVSLSLPIESEITQMKKVFLTFIAALGLMAGAAHAAGGGIAWDKAPDRSNDLGALQNGAKLFVN